MTRATLAEVLHPALEKRYAVAGVVCLGWEDARAYVSAAEAERAPIILQAGPGCRAHTPISVIGAMFRHLADAASIPVVLHLDHGATLEEAQAALAEGFTSIMFDGSSLPLDQNIRKTAEIVKLARSHGASSEGEVGFVGYDNGAASALTEPVDAMRFASETGVDAMAVAVGNVHLQQNPGDGIDEQALAGIAKATNGQVPLVIHGGSGVPALQRAALAKSSPICKFNIGTELRMVFGQALRRRVNDGTNEFDRLALLSSVHDPLAQTLRGILRQIGSSDRY
ncbi:class II fructose-bisphosphate aldolase [Thioclava sp. FR2]|uniref:class II fructose-bisphosphate aldolase n=1 Tax=Thioclava sp. FR2 TaxID=3445780 RepID=UPI003EBEDCAB